MNRGTLVLVGLLSLTALRYLPAQVGTNATAAATIPANPKDVSTADAIIKALYDANTIMVDRKREADRFRSLMLPGVRFMPTARTPNGVGIMRIQTLDDYVRAAMSGQPRHGFSEREIARKSEAFGNIMHVFSTYEARRDSADTTPTRGINSIQLFNDGARWWVVGVMWDSERPGSPIPAEYLKSTGGR